MTENLLLLSEKIDKEDFENYFEEIDQRSLADVMIKARKKSEILIDGEPIESWDALYLEPHPKAFNFSRVFLEIINQKEIKTNIDSSSLFILSKKPYLFNVLTEKQVPKPTTSSISTERGLTEIEDDLDFPVIVKKYEKMEKKEVKIIETFEELKSFSENSEHGENYFIIQEYEEKEVFEVLYIDGQKISLKTEGNPWKSESEIKRKYHSLSDKQKEVVEKAAKALGSKICSLRLNGEEVTDMNPDPQLTLFKEKSGKSVHSRIANLLKNGDDEE